MEKTVYGTVRMVLALHRMVQTRNRHVSGDTNVPDSRSPGSEIRAKIPQQRFFPAAESARATKTRRGTGALNPIGIKAAGHLSYNGVDDPTFPFRDCKRGYHAQPKTFKPFDLMQLS